MLSRLSEIKDRLARGYAGGGDASGPDDVTRHSMIQDVGWLLTELEITEERCADLLEELDEVRNGPRVHE